MLHLQQSIWADRAYILLETESITSAYDENSLSHTPPLRLRPLLAFFWISSSPKELNIASFVSVFTPIALLTVIDPIRSPKPLDS